MSEQVRRSLIAHLIVAAAVQDGAALCVPHPAASPFAADLTGRRLGWPGPGWRIGRAPGGFAWSLPAAPANPGETLKVAVSGGEEATDLPGWQPDVWLLLPLTSPLPGYVALHPHLPEVWIRDGCHNARIAPLEALAGELTGGDSDVWDWMQEVLVGRTGLLDLHLSGTGSVELVLDPIGLVVPESGDEARQIALSGDLRLTNGRPIRLYLPTFGAELWTCSLAFSGPGDIAVSSASSDLPLGITQADNEVVVTCEDAIERVLWVDLTLKGRGAVLEGCRIHLAVSSDDASITQEDPLAIYDDPLAVYGAGPV